MSEDKNRGKNPYDLVGGFSIMRELQHALYKIARSAELRDPELLSEIQIEAEIALRFVDSFMYTTKLESGQLKLELDTVGLGSLLHESAYEVRDVVGADVSVNSGDKHPVLANVQLIKSFLFSAGYFMAKSSKSELKFSSFKAPKDKVGIAVVSRRFDVSSAELKVALENEYSHMPLAKHSEQSQIMLALANLSARALGSEMTVKKIGGNKGFAIFLNKSEQLALV